MFSGRLSVSLVTWSAVCYHKKAVRGCEAVAHVLCLSSSGEGRLVRCFSREFLRSG